MNPRLPLALALFVLFACPLPLNAQKYPERPIRVTCVRRWDGTDIQRAFDRGPSDGQGATVIGNRAGGRDRSSQSRGRRMPTATAVLSTIHRFGESFLVGSSTTIRSGFLRGSRAHHSVFSLVVNPNLGSVPSELSAYIKRIGQRPRTRSEQHGQVNGGLLHERAKLDSLGALQCTPPARTI